jgi:hypothetical protein
LNRHAGDARAARVADALNANFYATFHTAFIGRINADDRNLPVHDRFGFAALEFDFEVVAAVQLGCPVTAPTILTTLLLCACAGTTASDRSAPKSIALAIMVGHL